PFGVFLRKPEGHFIKGRYRLPRVPAPENGPDLRGRFLRDRVPVAGFLRSPFGYLGVGARRIEVLAVQVSVDRLDDPVTGGDRFNHGRGTAYGVARGEDSLDGGPHGSRIDHQSVSAGYLKARFHE